MKNILFLVGSNSDINKKDENSQDKPTAIVENLEKAIEEVNKKNPEMQIHHRIESCSADRTPFSLAAVINEAKYDGIIYHGGYALVLGAAIQETLLHLKSTKKIIDPREELEKFMKSDYKKQYMPGNFDVALLRYTESEYFCDDRFIPTIGVPGKDTPSQGVTALTSIIENPSGCEPRPAVGLNKVDTAVRCMYHILYNLENGFEELRIVWESYGDSYDIYRLQKEAPQIAKIAESFGFKNVFVEPIDEYLNKEPEIEDKDLVIFIGSNYTGNSGNETTLEELDNKLPFLINCPAKKDMTNKWKEYLDTLSRLNHTISVGIGNYDNAIILAAQLSRNPTIIENMWEYRNSKTMKSVVQKPAWLNGG